MTRKTLYMESTEIPPERTAAEISKVLIEGGATQIATEYEAGRITGLRWTMRVNGQEKLFSMPTRVDPIYNQLSKRHTRYYSMNEQQRAYLRTKAERVAWRQLLRWVQAQMAMIDTGMVQAHEVFFPYLHMGQETVFSLFEKQQLTAIEGPQQLTAIEGPRKQ